MTHPVIVHRAEYRAPIKSVQRFRRNFEQHSKLVQSELCIPRNLIIKFD